MFSVNIDFNEASALWMENKRKNKNGMYNYICSKICKNKNKCNRKVWLQTECCKIHQPNKKIN